MKTKMQIRFEYLINEIIKAEPFITARDVVLEDFRLESERNYDLFCDNVYDLMMSHKGNLFIDERGFSYINGHPYNCKHVYFELLTSEDVAEEKEDVIEYIDLALKRLSWHLETIKRSIKDGYK